MLSDIDLPANLSADAPSDLDHLTAPGPVSFQHSNIRVPTADASYLVMDFAMVIDSLGQTIMEVMEVPRSSKIYSFCERFIGDGVDLSPLISYE